MRRVATKVVGLISIVLVASACGGPALAEGREGDIAFAQQMIPHHQQAVEMSEIALSKDAGAAVTELAREIRREQDPEIVLMRAWLSEWGAQEAPHVGGPGQEADDGHDHAMPGMATGEQLVALAEAQGAAFDDLWLELMIAHHEGAVEMAEQVQDSSDDAEVQALAAAIIDGQREEIARMSALLDR